MSFLSDLKKKFVKNPEWEPTYVVKNEKTGPTSTGGHRKRGAHFTRKARRPYGTRSRMRAEKKEKVQRKMANASRKINRQ